MNAQTRQNWPTQLRLPGQAAAPEGPVDMQMMYVMHHAFRRDLTRFAAATQATPVHDRRTWQRLAARWDVFATILHKHHSGEDAGLWPWLRERASADEIATLDAMEAEHDEIDPMLESCRAGFERLRDHPDEDARAALAVRVLATRESLGRHLAHEETDAMAILQRLMTQEEWLELDAEYFSKDMSPKYVATVVPWAAHEMPAAARGRVFAEAGTPFTVVWHLTRRSFARKERRAFAFA